jgi:hypothetical protein
MGQPPRRSDKREGEAALRKLRAAGEAWLTVGGVRALVRLSVPVSFWQDRAHICPGLFGVLVVHGGRLQIGHPSGQGKSGAGVRLTGDFTPHTFRRNQIKGEVLEIHDR